MYYSYKVVRSVIILHMLNWMSAKRLFDHVVKLLWVTTIIAIIMLEYIMFASRNNI